MSSTKQPIDAILKDFGFLPPLDVQGRSSIVDLFRAKPSCGIYVLHFENDEYYVGQTLNVTRRYIQHRKNHPDICRISFKSVHMRQLDQEEAQLIWSLEDRNIYLRNIDLTSILSHEPSSFDQIMSPENQQKWLQQVGYIDTTGERPSDIKRVKLYIERYAAFRQMPLADEILTVFRTYVRVGIPALFAGEGSYWAISCLPPPPYNVLIRVNISWQEVFLVDVLTNRLWFYICLSKRALQQRFGNTLRTFTKRYPDATWEDGRYRAGGADQVTVEIWGKQSALTLLNDPDVIPAIRLYNLRIAKKGRSPWRKSHNFSLMDEMIPLIRS